MYYVDHQKFDLMKLKPTERGTLTLRDLKGFEASIVSAWEQILAISKSNGKVRFRCPHIGQLSKHQGGSFPRRVNVRDETGTHIIVWCNNAIPLPGGGFEYTPANVKYEKATFELDPNKDIEEILWHMCFSHLRNQTITISVGNKRIDQRKLYMVDVEKDATEYLNEAGRSGSAIFYLTQSPQHINDDDFVNAIASLYEISRPESMSNAVKRQKILQMVTNADASGDKDKDSSFFIKCVQDYQEGDLYSNLVILVQKAFDRRLISFDQQSLRVYLLGANQVRLDSWTPIAVNDAPRWKKALARWLMSRPDKVEILEASIEEKPITPQEPRKFYLPDPLTEDYFTQAEGRGGMRWADMKALVGLIPNVNQTSIGSIKRPEAAKILISYFIKERKKLAPELLKSEP